MWDCILTLNSQITPHNLPSQVSYGVTSCVVWRKGNALQMIFFKSWCYSHHSYSTDQSSMIPPDPWWLAAGCRLCSNQFALARGRGPSGTRGYLRTFNGIQQQWRVEYLSSDYHEKDKYCCFVLNVIKIPQRSLSCQQNGWRWLGISMCSGIHMKISLT